MGIREDTHLKGQEYVRSLVSRCSGFPDHVAQIRLAYYLWYAHLAVLLIFDYSHNP